MLQKLRFYTRHSFNDLRVNGQRTIFALLCIAAGVAAIVSLQTLGVMIKDTLTGNLQESNRGDIRISIRGAGGEDGGGATSDLTFERGKQEGVVAEEKTYGNRYITQDGLNTIQDWFDQKYPGQAQITYRQVLTDPTQGMSVTIPSRDTDKPFVVSFIVETQVYPFYGEIKSVNGKPLRDLIQAPSDIVFSKNLADDLDAQVGDQVRLSGATEDFTLRGIVPTDSEGGFENFGAALLGYYYLDVSAISLFQNAIPAADMVYVRLQDPSKLDEINTAFSRRFSYLDTQTTADLENQNADISKYLNQMVIIMGLVSLLIGGIGIVNTMLVIVSRRTTEVAVLKTIGLEGEQVTTLFLVEAVIMGIFGSLIGILLGWLAAYLLKNVAGQFITESLVYHITPTPAIIGFIVGIVITTIFGFMPTLAAGQVRPSLVLRPTESIVPKAGRLRSFAALIVVVLMISLVAQFLISDLLSSRTLRATGITVGGVLGFLMGLPMVIGGILSGWTRRKIGLRILRWGLLLIGLPLLGALFGYFVPAVLILSNTFIVVGILYVVLIMLIWTVGGGSLSDLWLLKFNRIRRSIKRRWTWITRLSNWQLTTGLIVLLLLPWIVNSALIIFTLPFWFVGRIIQRLAFVDLKIALRSMLASKGRNASTLLALVIGVFTLSLITMLAQAFLNRFEQLMIDEVGGNVIIEVAGASNTMQLVNDRLAALPGVKSYTVAGTYDAQLVSAELVDTGQKLTLDQLKMRAQQDKQVQDWEVENMDYYMSSIDSRSVDSNLPNVQFYSGRQLAPSDADKPYIVITANNAVIASGLKVGDKLTFEIGGGGDSSTGSQKPQQVTFEIIGMIDRRVSNIEISVTSPCYAPSGAFPEGIFPNRVGAIVDVDESQVKALRRSMADIPGTFVLETRLLNDLINRVIRQFTSFPILVAALALFTGGVVIANSVALSTMERRREIGIMKAVGLQRERVLGMLLLEYGLMGLVGGLIGVGIGGLILLFLLAQMFGGELGNAFPYLTALELMGMCIVIALVAAIITAWHASGEKPLNVLRYE